MNLVRCCGAIFAGWIAAQASPAAAQATRTWVSGTGDDVNPCSRSAPCKTFAGAIAKTAAGGAINCLDPGGYGAITITKAISISCLYTEGGVLAGGNGIIVNAGPTDVIFLRGLDVFGVNPPQNGIRFISGAALHIDNVVIRRFDRPDSYGVLVEPGTDAKVYIKDSIIADNGAGGRGGGVNVQPTGTARATVFIMDSIISNNAGQGLSGVGAGADIHVTGTRVLGNATGVIASKGARVTSYGDNIVMGNAADGAFSGAESKD
jgi:hypothetical protein